jgi:hypothetical protein
MDSSERLDAIMLGWLAREARFRIYVYFAPSTPIGYQVNRMVMLTKRKEPLFTEWMNARHGIDTHKVQKNETIQQVIDILMPIRELVYDRDKMERMQYVLNSYPRRWKHDDIMRLVDDIDGGMLSVVYMP